MVINLKQLYNITGEKLVLDYAVNEERLKSVKGYTFLNPISVKGTVINRAGVVLLDYTADFTLRVCCDRCLAEFVRDYSYEFSHVLVRSLENDDDGYGEYVVTETDELDMDELAITDCLLELPSKLLCKEDCKGLCPVCGTNLNEKQCNCKG